MRHRSIDLEVNSDKKKLVLKMLIMSIQVQGKFENKTDLYCGKA